MSGALRKEIKHWCFLDTWKDCLPWTCEKHVVVRLFSDSSEFAWRDVISAQDKPPFDILDYWTGNKRVHHIAVKEAFALVKVLQAGKANLVDMSTFIQTVRLIYLWQKQGGKIRELNDALKQLHRLALEYNMILSFQYIPSKSNPTDQPSRELSDKDCTLSRPAWHKIHTLVWPPHCRFDGSRLQLPSRY